MWVLQSGEAEIEDVYSSTTTVNTKASQTIIEAIYKDSTPEPTPTPAGGADKSANAEKITSVKTGDADGISMWIVLIAACIIIGTFAALRRKK